MQFFVVAFPFLFLIELEDVAKKHRGDQRLAQKRALLEQDVTECMAMSQKVVQDLCQCGQDAHDNLNR